MNIIRSIIVWFLGITILIVLFPLTFIIWLLVLPFDKERTVTHWLLIGHGVILSMLLPIWKIDIEGRGKGHQGNNVRNNIEPSVDTRYNFTDVFAITGSSGYQKLKM